MLLATVLPVQPAEKPSPAASSAVRMVRSPPLEPVLLEALVQLWVAITNADEAMGSVAPLDAAGARALADAALARVAAGADDLAVAYHEERPVGFGFLCANELALNEHWGTIRLLQCDPQPGAGGAGAVLLAELEEMARGRGVEQVLATVPAGSGREGFYLEHGYVIQARLPARIKAADGRYRDELLLAKHLPAPPPPGVALRLRRLDAGLPLPAYAHAGDAGLDLYARGDVTLRPGERAIVPTGVAIAVPQGCVGLVHPRSGLAASHGVALVNAPGTIDAGYRGEVKVILVNLDPREAVTLARGQRIAQLVVQRVEAVQVVEVDALDDTSRGRGGFGSSGR